MIKANLVGEVYDTTELVAQIESATESGEDIELLVNSVGGSVFDGLQVVNAIQKNGRVTANVEVMSASISACITLACNKFTIGKNDLMVLHNSWTMAVGNKEELREEAEVMDKIDGILHNIILEHCNDAERIEAELNEGKDVYLSGEEVAELFDNCELVERNNNGKHQNSIMPKLIDRLKASEDKDVEKEEPAEEKDVEKEEKPYEASDELKELLAYDE